MNPRDFGTLATRLAAGEHAQAAELRTAVSRAYYAAFNVAAALLKKMGIELPATGDGHRLLTVALRYCADAELTAVAHDFDELRGLRWAADYDMESAKVEDQRTVRKCCARAKQMIKKMDQCSTDAPRFMAARVKIRNWAGSADGAQRGIRLL